MSPLGKYGNAVASAAALGLILAAILSHIIPGLVPDAWLDNASLLAVGVVFGTQVVQNGTQTKATQALALSAAANARLDAIGTVSAPTATGGTPPVVSLVPPTPDGTIKTGG